MITAKICIDCPVALQKGLKKNGRAHLPSISTPQFVVNVWGKKKMLELYLMN